MQVNISLNDGFDLDRFSERLSEIGATVSQKLKFLNTLTAEIPDQRLQEVRAMEGVRSAEPDHQVHAV